MKWLRDLLKYRSVKRYLHRLPAHLRGEHGKQTSYSPVHVLDAIKALKLNEKFAIYAIAAFSPEPAAKLYAQEQKLNDDISEIRNEVAELYFGGNHDFAIDDINNYAGLDSAVNVDNTED